MELGPGPHRGQGPAVVPHHGAGLGRPLSGPGVPGAGAGVARHFSRGVVSLLRAAGSAGLVRGVQPILEMFSIYSDSVTQLTTFSGRPALEMLTSCCSDFWNSGKLR